MADSTADSTPVVIIPASLQEEHLVASQSSKAGVVTCKGFSVGYHAWAGESPPRTVDGRTPPFGVDVTIHYAEPKAKVKFDAQTRDGDQGPKTTIVKEYTPRTNREHADLLKMVNILEGFAQKSFAKDAAQLRAPTDPDDPLRRLPYTQELYEACLRDIKTNWASVIKFDEGADVMDGFTMKAQVKLPIGDTPTSDAHTQFYSIKGWDGDTPDVERVESSISVLSRNNYTEGVRKVQCGYSSKSGVGVSIHETQIIVTKAPQKFTGYAGVMPKKRNAEAPPAEAAAPKVAKIGDGFSNVV